MGNINILFKDTGLNERNNAAYKRNMKELADAIRASEAEPDALRALILKGLDTSDGRNHNPNHNSCDYKNSVNDRVTEKRICRCMFYYNRPATNSEQKIRCSECNFKARWENISDYQVLDYEVPMNTVTQNVGGIDLILKSQGMDMLYAVELKPPNSKETLLRMVAEILTYTNLLDNKVKIEGKEYEIQPAICFFKHKHKIDNTGSYPALNEYTVQWTDYLKWKGDVDFVTMMNSVTVFCMTVENGAFEINKM